MAIGLRGYLYQADSTEDREHMLLLLADLISNSPARDDVGFGINIRCKYPNLAHPLVSSCCRKEERLFLNVCPTGGNRKEHSKAKTKNTHREPRKFAMLVTETSKRDAASAPISPKKKCAQRALQIMRCPVIDICCFAIGGTALWLDKP